MQIFTSMVLIFLCYSVYSYATCDKSFRDSKLFFITGAGCSMLAQIIWMWLSRRLNNVSQILMYNSIKTAIIILAGVLVPILFFEAKISKTAIVGVVLIIIGGLMIRK